MRRFLILSPIAIIFSVLSLLTLGLGMAIYHPLPSYHLFFPLQDFSERSVLTLDTHHDRVIQYSLELLEIRMNDLKRSAGTDGELAALGYLDQALDSVLEIVSERPEIRSDSYEIQFERLVEEVLASLPGLLLIPAQSPVLLAEFQVKLETLQNMLEEDSVPIQAIQDLLLARNASTQDPERMLESPSLAASTNASPASVAFQRVPFPPGSQGALHTFFPLLGTHSEIDCGACHTGFQYSGLPATCLACHQEERPAVHYPVECSVCHQPTSWQDITIDHSSFGTSDCRSCHERVRPPDHYQGQCSACHSTLAWLPANFDHSAAQATDCGSCHQSDRPVNHYPGQCGACHDTDQWLPANFNHAVAGATECGSCHQPDQPANHYPGQCGACHNTDQWLPANFNHAVAGATDCVSCHSSDQPPNHYQSQCSACHDTDGWSPATFNHGAVGATDCQSCHLPDRPPNHFEGQCISCHTTEDWLPANFDHSLVSNDCSACHEPDRPANHFGGQCSACHSTNGWLPATFDHAAVGAIDCISCHLADRPVPHFDGQCSSCHNTENWSDATFDHTFPMNHEGANGQCALCHPAGTSAWTCENCHSMSEMLEEHEDIPDIAGRCIECHPDGQED